MWYLYTPHPHINHPAQPNTHTARRALREHSNGQAPTTGTNQNNITGTPKTQPRPQHYLQETGKTFGTERNAVRTYVGMHTATATHQQPAPAAHPPGENEDTHPHTHRGRGVAILFARDLEAAVTDPPTIIRDPAGHYLAVQCTIYGQDTMFIGAYADKKSDARQEPYYSRLYAALPPVSHPPITVYLSTQITPRAGPSTAAAALPLNRTTPEGVCVPAHPRRILPS